MFRPEKSLGKSGKRPSETRTIVIQFKVIVEFSKELEQFFEVVFALEIAKINFCYLRPVENLKFQK